jgi:hypothetical protein
MTLYLTNIARGYESLGQWDKAMEFYFRVIDVALGGGGARSPEVCVALEDIAYCYIQRNVPKGGLMYFMRAFDISFSL